MGQGLTGDCHYTLCCPSRTNSTLQPYLVAGLVVDVHELLGHLHSVCSKQKIVESLYMQNVSSSF